MESKKKVHESLDTFIRQTMGHEPYMSFNSRPSEKPLQRIIEHQQAMNKCDNNLKVDIDICDGLEDNANVEPHQVNIDKDSCRTKERSNWERGLQIDWNLQTIKSTVPQVQLQKCKKCSSEFFSSFNQRRHIRIHRRISQIDKEDLILKRKNIVVFWNKLNQDEMQQIFLSLRKYNFEGLSGELIISHLLALKKQSNEVTLPSAYSKAGQDLLDILDNKQIVFPLLSEQILSILDEASEKTFLYSQGDVSKIVLEEKNLVAFLGFIFEQTLVKAWMADKEAEALRNQQELVKEEEAAQMKRARIVAKKKKKKEKSRQKGLKERKGGIIQLALNEDNESIDGENIFLEIVEEDNSPTASSTSMNSFGVENSLSEHLEMEVNHHDQNSNGSIHVVNRNNDHLLKLKDILPTHMTSKEVVSESIDEQAQNNECDLAFHGNKEEHCSNFPPSSQIILEYLGGCGNQVLEQDQSVVESCKHTLLKPFKEQIKDDYQDSYYRGSWTSDPRFQEGVQQNSYKTLQKHVTGIPHISNIELGNNPIARFYRGKSTSLKGTTTFPTTQQWAKKAQTPAAIDHITKDGHDNESSMSKNNPMDVILEQTILAREVDASNIGGIKRVEKEEFKIFEKKEPLSVAIQSVAKVVVGTGGLRSTPSASFNLNVNSKDWPPLSNLHATQYPKNAAMYSSTSNQCEVNSRPSNKVNMEKEGGHQVLFESKVEESLVTSTPRMKDLIKQTTIGSVNTGLRKGIMIGSVSVPLDDYVHSSKLGLGSASRRISMPLQVHQSYTAALAAPPVQHTQDAMTSTVGRQKSHDGINNLTFADSSSIQVMESYRGPGHYEISSLKPTPSTNLNVRHMRGPNYPLGDRGERGILPKQPSSSSGPIRHLPQKVWRPVPSVSENANPNLRGRISIESKPLGFIEKETEEPARIDNDIDVALFQVEDKQDWNMNTSKVDQCVVFATNSITQVGNQICILDTNHEKEKTQQGFTKYNEPLVLNNEHIQIHQEISEVTSMTRVDNGNVCQYVKKFSMEQNVNHINFDKKDVTKNMDDKAHLETIQSHSTWIAKALEFHLNRWQLGLKDPETIVCNCEEEHPELQTSKWIEFLNSLSSKSTKLNFQKYNIYEPILRTYNGSDLIGKKNHRNLLKEQGSINAQNLKSEGNKLNFQIDLFNEDLQAPSLVCRSGPPCEVYTTLIGPISGLQSHGKGNNEGQIESRCGSSCSDSSLSNDNSTKKQDWMDLVNVKNERLQEKRYMSK